MDTPLASNIINLFVAIGTIGAVIVALVGIWLNRRQARNDWLHAQQLATEERQDQSRPIIVPMSMEQIEVAQNEGGPGIHIEDGKINWIYQGKINLNLENMGGVALNIHSVLYGSESIHISQFVSWDNGPSGKGPVLVQFDHPQQLYLNPDDSIDGIHPIYDNSLDSSSNPIKNRMACLTVTYHDLFGIKHVSIFNYTLEHRWIRMTISKIPSLNGKPPLDLKELNDQKKQQAPKWSAPPIITS